MAQTLRRGPVTGTAIKQKKRKPFLLDLYSTAVGKKFVMAITGLLGVGFIVSHMVGNLKFYIGTVMEHGKEVYDVDVYGAFLRKMLVPIVPEQGVIWLLRLGLIALVLIHIHAAYTLTVLNHKARPVKYQSRRDYQAANFASRSMRWTGVIVLLFIIWHLMDLTWGWVHPDFIHGAVHHNIVASFQRPAVVAIYVIANLALGTHLFHGVWSLFQSLGWNNPKFNAWRRGIATAIAAVVVIANVSFPISVVTGLVDHDDAYNLTHEAAEMETGS